MKKLIVFLVFVLFACGESDTINGEIDLEKNGVNCAPLPIYNIGGLADLFTATIEPDLSCMTHMQEYIVQVTFNPYGCGLVYMGDQSDLVNTTLILYFQDDVQSPVNPPKDPDFLGVYHTMFGPFFYTASNDFGIVETAYPFVTGDKIINYTTNQNFKWRFKVNVTGEVNFYHVGIYLRHQQTPSTSSIYQLTNYTFNTCSANTQCN